MLESVRTPIVATPEAGVPARDPRTLRLAGILGLIAFVLSALGSWIPSFWGDEAASIMSAERTLPSLFMMLGNVDAVHGTYYLFLHFWIQGFGASPFSVRFPSAVAVGVAVVGVVLLGERLAGYRVALLAGVVCALLPRITYMGEEARGYAFSAAGAVWLTVLLVSLIGRRERRLIRWIPYAVLLAACAYVFLFSVLIVVAHAVILLSVTRSRRILGAWMLASAAAIAAAAPLIYWAVSERKQIAYLADADAVNGETLGVDQWFGNVALGIVGWALILTALVIAARAMLRARRGAVRTTTGRATGGRATAFRAAGILTPRAAGMPSLFVVAASWALIPMAILLVANLFDKLYTVRYLSFAAPAVALLIGLVLALPARRWVSVVGLVAVLGASAPSYVFQRTPFGKNSSDWAQIADTIADHAKPGDAVVFDDSGKMSRRTRLAMHTYPAAFAGLIDPTLVVPYQDDTKWWDRTQAVSAAAGHFADIDRVWAIEYHLPDEPADHYGMASLRTLGYAIVAEYPGHSSTVYELAR